MTQPIIFRRSQEIAGIVQVLGCGQGHWKSCECYWGTSSVRSVLSGEAESCAGGFRHSFPFFQVKEHRARDCLYEWEVRQQGPQSDRQAEHSLSRMQRSLRLNDLHRAHPPRRTKGPGEKKDESRGMVCAGPLCGAVVTSCSDFTLWAQSDPG